MICRCCNVCKGDVIKGHYVLCAQCIWDIHKRDENYSDYSDYHDYHNIGGWKMKKKNRPMVKNIEYIYSRL